MGKTVCNHDVWLNGINMIVRESEQYLSNDEVEYMEYTYFKE